MAVNQLVNILIEERNNNRAIVERNRQLELQMQTLQQSVTMMQSEINKLKQKREQDEAIVKHTIDKLIPISDQQETLLNKFTKMETDMDSARQQQMESLNNIATKISIYAAFSSEQQEAVVNKLTHSIQIREGLEELLEKIISIETHVLSAITTSIHQQQNEQDTPTLDRMPPNRAVIAKMTGAA